ncbi:MAG: glycosyltransferase [Candidatus Thermoplasmatota archaeon]|nr:glycosyltransferase [Candidatus Thermoplasmatota archaeon]MBU1941479.1 glycosyltransferase [Candidatus Thermoplasmatota archaeon]
MNQPWNHELTLQEPIQKQSQNIKPIDIMVGVLCKNVETTVLNVLNVINEGLYRYFPDYKKAIVVSEGNSTDKTKEVLGLFQPYNSIHKLVTTDITTGGKGVGVMTIFEIAHQAQAKCVVLIDGDLLSIKPGWIQNISNPILYGRADLTVPYYIRDKNDGVITNNLVYPFTRALYGIDIRQPIAGEFALSRNLYEILRNHPLFPPDFGVDIFIVTVAAAEGLKVKESLYSLKIHESTTRYLEPEKFLVPMFRRVTGSMFRLAQYYESFWKNKPRYPHITYYRECFSQKPIPVKININQLIETFRTEFYQNKDTMTSILPQDMIQDIEHIINNPQKFDPELWVEIVYSYAAAYKNADEKQQKSLIESLKPLWIGRFVSYALETKDMDINQAETVLQKQAEVFEEKFNYLISIY